MAKLIIEVELEDEDVQHFKIDTIDVLDELRLAVYVALNELDDDGNPTLPCREEDVRLGIEW